mgnify:CR=1 FL=1
MKLITEMTQDIEVITEESNGKKSVYITGPFVVSETVNKNGRIYPHSILKNEVNRYMSEAVKENRAYGELGHPATPTITLKNVSHMIKDIREDGNRFIGKAKIMDTPMGNIARNLIDEGANLGVSSRGLGTLKQNSKGIMEVQSDFRLATVADIVADPSAPGAFVKGIMENVEFYYDALEGTYHQKTVDQLHTHMKKMSKREIDEAAVKLFEEFFRKLSK